MADQAPHEPQEEALADKNMITDLVAEGMEIMSEATGGDEDDDERYRSIEEAAKQRTQIPKTILATIVSYLEKKAFWENELKDSERFARTDFASTIYPDGRKDVKQAEIQESEKSEQHKEPQSQQPKDPSPSSKDLPIDDIAEEIVSQYGSEVLFFLKMLDGVDRTLNRLKSITNDYKKSITLDRILADMEQGNYDWQLCFNFIISSIQESSYNHAKLYLQPAFNHQKLYIHSV